MAIHEGKHVFHAAGGQCIFSVCRQITWCDPLEGDLVPEPECLISKLRNLSGADMPILFDWLKNNADPVIKMSLEENPNEPDLQTSRLADIYIDELTERRAVWCWYNAYGESAAMWSIYGNAGIAINTTLEHLTRLNVCCKYFQGAVLQSAGKV